MPIDITKSRVAPGMPLPTSFAEAPAQRNKSDAWAKAASKLTLPGILEGGVRWVV